MKRTLWAVGLSALCLPWAPSPAHAVTAAVCINSTLNGSLRLRVTGTCKATEIRIGSFDGTTLQFSGINVQIVSGAGSTGAPVNGKGNLIVGYDAITTSPTQTGSHNVIIGDEHTFTTYGGLVAGSHNAITGVSASVSGGVNNTASAQNASVSGGAGGHASGVDASVSGGNSNTASGPGASVSGGGGNTASGFGASVSGGLNNIASSGSLGLTSNNSISGGGGNTASGTNASVSGGVNNVASGDGSSISGGAALTQPVADGWAAGSVTPGNTINGDFESP